MAGEVKTSGKRHKLRGAVDGKPFTTTNQPTPEQKKFGWQELRKQRLLTQGIIKLMLNPDGTPTPTFDSYFDALVKNARAGNPKAIDAINKCLEDDIVKTAMVDTEGNDVDPLAGIFKVQIVPPKDDE